MKLINIDNKYFVCIDRVRIAMKYSSTGLPQAEIKAAKLLNRFYDVSDRKNRRSIFILEDGSLFLTSYSIDRLLKVIDSTIVKVKAKSKTTKKEKTDRVSNDSSPLQDAQF